MTAFTDLASGMVDDVFDTFGDAAAVLEPGDGSEAVTVRAYLRPGTGEGVLDHGRIVMPGDRVQVPYADAPGLKARDVITIDGVRLRLVGAPQRPGNGLIWEAPVERLAAS